MAARLATPTHRRRTLFLPVGMRGSGKTFFADMLNRDLFCTLNQAQNGWTFGELCRRVEARIRHDARHIFVDALLPHRMDRDVLANIALRFGLQVVFVQFSYTLSECMTNMLERIRDGVPHPYINDQDAAITASFSNRRGEWTLSQSERARYPWFVKIFTVGSFTRAKELAQNFNRCA